MRNGIHAEVEDWHGLHWHFSTVKPEADVKSYKVRFGPFLRGCEAYGVRGFNIIVMDAGREVFDAWIAQEYPELAEQGINWDEKFFRDADVMKLFKDEQEKYWQALKDAVFPTSD